jgi:amino acid transporter
MSKATLRTNCLGFGELLAQSVALISPTMTAALIIPVMFSNTGNWSWLSYLIGTAMLLFVALNLNQFARRSSCSGSMYAYISRGLGLTAGGIGGWALIWAYLGISMAGVTGFAIFAGKLLLMMGIDCPPVVLFAVCVGGAWFCAWKNVQLSAMLMLVLEGASMALIAVLCLITLGRHGFQLDHTQFAVSTLPWSKLGLGVVVAIFSLVGFECATAFGDEARDSLRSIPRAVWMSLLISGGFFVFVTYVMVQATQGYKTPLDQIDAPLNVMAVLVHMPALQAPLSAGAMVSFFALCLSCVNAGARVIFAMGRHGLFHAATADAHAHNATPHIAVTLVSLIALIVPSALVFLHCAPLDIFNWVGTLAAFGFLVPYFMISLAAPTYLKQLGQLKIKDVVLCVASLTMLVLPAVGSVYPLPPAPVLYFPYLFLAYLTAGVVWIIVFHRTRPTAHVRIREDLDLAHAKHQPAQPATQDLRVRPETAAPNVSCL